MAHPVTERRNTKISVRRGVPEGNQWTTIRRVWDGILIQPPRESSRLGSFFEGNLDRNTGRVHGSLQRGLRSVLGRPSKNEHWGTSSVVEYDAPNVETGVRFPGSPPRINGGRSVTVAPRPVKALERGQNPSSTPVRVSLIRSVKSEQCRQDGSLRRKVGRGRLQKSIPE